jgi:hypothetical protein
MPEAVDDASIGSKKMRRMEQVASKGSTAREKKIKK